MDQGNNQLEPARYVLDQLLLFRSKPSTSQVTSHRKCALKSQREVCYTWRFGNTVNDKKMCYPAALASLNCSWTTISIAELASQNYTLSFAFSFSKIRQL